jgi:hypothetical protein
MYKLHLKLHTLADIQCAWNTHKENSTVYIKDTGLMFHTVPLLFITFFLNQTVSLRRATAANCHAGITLSLKALLHSKCAP